MCASATRVPLIGRTSHERPLKEAHFYERQVESESEEEDEEEEEEKSVAKKGKGKSKAKEGKASNKKIGRPKKDDSESAGEAKKVSALVHLELPRDSSRLAACAFARICKSSALSNQTP